MSSIQIGSFIYFTVLVIGSWIFFSIIFLQLKRFMVLSPYVPLVSKILTIILILLTLAGYGLIFMPESWSFFSNTTTTNPRSGNFDTY